jgi:uncharacterized membrane protein YtjA (UPF0391 family)
MDIEIRLSQNGSRGNPFLGGRIMLGWAVTFFIVALIAAILGFGGIAGTASWIAQVLFVVFLILFLVSLISGRRSPAV